MSNYILEDQDVRIEAKVIDEGSQRQYVYSAYINDKPITLNKSLYISKTLDNFGGINDLIEFETKRFKKMIKLVIFMSDENQDFYGMNLSILEALKTKKEYLYCFRCTNKEHARIHQIESWRAEPYPVNYFPWSKGCSKCDDWMEPISEEDWKIDKYICKVCKHTQVKQKDEEGREYMWCLSCAAAKAKEKHND